jgi:hypothetical protein
MTKQNNAHRRALEKIAANPEKFGFEHVVSAAIESNLRHNGRGILAQPDIILETSQKEVYIIEYKGNGDKDLLERARGQLENAVWWFGRYRLDILPENLHTKIISGTDPKYGELLR